MLDYDLTCHNQNKNFISNGIHNETNNGCNIANDNLESLSSNMSNEKSACSTPVSNPHVKTLRRSTRISNNLIGL